MKEYRVRKCYCGYVVAAELNETEKECVCGNVIEFTNNDLVLDEEKIESAFGESNRVIESEEKIGACIIMAHNEFMSLEPTHPKDLEDFMRGLREMQKVMAIRELRRLLPEKYPSMPPQHQQEQIQEDDK